MSALQIGLIIGAIVFVSIAVLILIGVLPGLRNDSGASATLVVWGFENADTWKEIQNKYSAVQKNVTIAYQQKNPQNFENDFINTLARGEFPDIIIFPSDYIEKHKDKLSLAPALLFTERELTQQYIDAASIFLTPKNEIFALPIYADALVLYSNTDLFAKHLIVSPPKTWEEFLDDAQRITEKDSSGNVIVSGAAMGRAVNIKNAPLILTTLFMQSGELIMSPDGRSVLGTETRQGDLALRPAESALRFFLDFSNTALKSQSWSPALPEARELFTSGRLGMYIGKISEYQEIKAKNPHLSFSISTLPQIKGGARPISGGELFGFAVPRASRNQTAAWQLVSFLTTYNISAFYGDSTGNISARRDVIPKYFKESVRSVFGEASLSLKLWPNPDPARSDAILREVIENGALQRSTLREILDKARAKLDEVKN